ncbi:MAG: hypothetical protein Q9M24_03805 [Mariprofundaceae bacterium]|nr:hypothetical protein [Mariprofundaceae bacterium]
MHGKIAWYLVALFFSACPHSVPDCADEQTVTTALEIAKKKLIKESSQDVVKQESLKQVDMRTTDMDKKLGKYTCAADLEVTDPAGSKRLPIQYTSELADGGKRFYVTVYGL